MIRIPSNIKKVREVTVTKEELISFETEVKERYENGEVSAPVHLSKGNEQELIEMVENIKGFKTTFLPFLEPCLIIPLTSCPKISGGTLLSSLPWYACMSAPQIPEATTLIILSPPT